MKIYEIYFSPTGGTKKVADILAEGFGVEKSEVDITDSMVKLTGHEFDKEDLAIIAVPSFGGRVPVSVNERLSLFKGNGTRAVLLCVYGNRAYEDTLVELEDIVKQNGFNVISAVAAIAEHSIVRQYAAGRPDKADHEELRAFSEKIKEKLDRADYTEPVLNGNRPYKQRGKSSVVPVASDECSRCGICAEKCPVNAIDIKDPTTVDSNACISCMRCIAVCPHGARRVNEALLETLGLALQKVCSERKGNNLYI